MSVDRYGALYVPETWSREILKITDPSSAAPELSVLAGDGMYGGVPTGQVPAATVGLGDPESVSVSPNLTVCVADQSWNRFVEITGVPSVPDAPAVLHTIAGDKSVTLTFDTPGDDGGSAITRYEYSIDGGLTWTTLDVTGEPHHSATITGLTAGTGYTFQVRAVNAVGVGPDLAGAAVTPTSTPEIPRSTDPATITGTDTVGHTLTCARGDWASDPSHYGYQWTRDGVKIRGATHSTYRLRDSDEGHDLSCTVTATDADGAARSTTTAVTVPLSRGAACPIPVGSLAGTVLGPVALGDTRTQARSMLPRFDRYSYHTDNFCLSEGPGIRLGYASKQLLGEAHMRHTLNGRIVLALTANRYYELDGVRPGTKVAAVGRQLGLGQPLRFGRNTWYTIHGPASTGVLKVRHGVIEEVGIANRQITGDRAAERRLLRSF